MKLKWNRLLVLPVMIAGIGLWLLWPHSNPKAGWFSEGWQYRKKITVTNNTSLETNKYVTLSSFDTSDNARFQTDCGDVRFIKQNGEDLPYYVVSGCDTSSTSFHINFDTLAAGAQDIYIYYGNATVANGGAAADFSSAATNATVGTPATEEIGPGPVLSWSMNENTGSTLNDDSINANSGSFGTSSSAPSWVSFDLCANGSCLKFDGSNDYVSKTYSTDTELDPGTTGFSVNAWFKHSSIQAGTDVIVSRVDGADANGIGYKIYMDSSGFICFGIDQTAGSFPVDSACSTTSYADSKWHQVSGVKNGTTSIILYIDGQQIAADTSITSTTISGSSPAFRVGIDNGFVNPWDGFIDAVKVYPYARSADQVKTDFTARGSVNGVGTQMGNSDMNKNLSNGLVGYWKMDESSAGGCIGGTNDSCDSSGNLNDGDWTNGATYTTVARFGNAVTLDGTNDSINIVDNDSLTPTDITISSWIKMTALPSSTGQDQFIMRKSHGVSPFNAYHWYVRQTDNKLRFEWYDSTGANNFLNSNTALTAGTWYHVAISKSGSIAKIFINGVEDASSSTFTVAMYNSTGPLRIGSNGSTANFYGQIDDVRLYNRGLEPREVAALYNWAPGPIAYWDLDEGSGQFSNDKSGNSLSGTLGSSSGDANQDPTWVTGKFGNALNFNQTNTQYVDIGNQSILYFPNSFTLSMWVKRTGTPSSIWGGYLLSDYSHTCTAASFAVRIDQANTVSFFWENPGGTTREATSTTALPLNTWSYVTAVYDGTNREIYVNGVLEGTNSIAQTRSDNGTTTTIGRPGACADLYAPAAIDEVKIYNYARTSSQIIEDMNGGHPVGSSPVGSQVGYWKFDEGYGTTAYDMSPNANNLTLTTASWTTIGIFGKAWNGTNANWLSQGSDDNQFDFAATEDFSISGWFKSDSANNPVGNEYVVSKSDASTKGYAVYFNSSGQACFGIDDDNTWTPTVASCSSTDYYDNTWHYIVAIRDTSADKLKLYVDKILVDSDTDTTTGTLVNSTYLIVGDRDASNNGDEFTGDIDEVKIYRAALTDEQIKLDYNQGQSTVMGAASTASDGITADNSSARAFCVPGDTSTCNPPIAWYKLDEKTGTSTINDSSGGNMTATTYNLEFEDWQIGKFGSAINFDGNDEYAQTTSNSGISGNSPFSVSLWSKVADTGSEDWWTNYALGLGVHTESEKSFNIAIIKNQVQFQSYLVNDLGSYLPGSNFNGTWIHVEATYDGTDVRMYINGILVDTTSWGTANLTNAPVTISAAGTGGGYTSPYKGILDDIKVYNYARSPAQVAWDFNQGKPVAWYKMDECTGTTIHNWALNGNGMAAGNDGTLTVGATGSNTSTGTCTGATTEAWKNGANGKINSSLSFDGSNDYVTIADNDVFSFGNSISDKPFSISSWIKMTDATSFPIAAKVATNTVTDTQEWIFFTDVDDKLYLQLNDLNTTNWIALPSASTLTSYQGQWIFVTATYDGSGSTNGMNLYINGKSIPKETPQGLGSYTAMENTAASLYIGALWPTDGTYKAFANGQIDDVRIFNYALTPLQVKTVMNNGSAVNFAPITGSP